MSLRHEQYRSLLSTRQFLFDLLDSSKRPKTVKAVKERAAQCLKHFPMLCEDGMPVFSKDEVGLPNADSVMRLKELLNEAAGLLSDHHAAHLCAFFGQCPVCSKEHTENYPENIFGRIERALSNVKP